MTNEDAVKWLSNLKDDIGRDRNGTLWHYGQAIDEIIEILKEQRWILVSEGLPKRPSDIVVRNWFIVSLESGHIMYIYFDFDRNEWEKTLTPVVAWMQLPKPYIDANNKNENQKTTTEGEATAAKEEAFECPYYMGVCGLDRLHVCYCKSDYKHCDIYQKYKACEEITDDSEW